MAKSVRLLKSNQNNGRVVQLFGKTYNLDENQTDTRSVSLQHQTALPDADEVRLDFSPCVVCGEVVVYGYYGHWGNGGACSKICEIAKENEPWVSWIGFNRRYEWFCAATKLLRFFYIYTIFNSCVIFYDVYCVVYEYYFFKNYFR